jgi:anaerobic magnesium-protoporphyrin IX monomethyl ester cyclase
MKIIISYPPLKGKGSPMLTQNRQFQWYHVPSYIYPLVPAWAATMLKEDGFDVVWNDAIAERWTYDRFLDFFTAEEPDAIAFETKTPVVKQHWRIIDQLKEIHPSCQFILMGDHATVLPAESMRNSSTDFVITGGDYDFSLLGAARHLRDGDPLPKGIWYRGNGTVVNSGEFELKHDLDQLPFIDRELTKAHLYGEKWRKRLPFFYTMAGRDCHWGRCTFCAWTTLYPSFRSRTPDNLLDEIGMLIERHGAREVFDDTGTFPAGGWLKRFCRGMIERGYSEEILFSCNMRFGYLRPEHVELMKQAGFRKMKMGLESANQSTLDRLNKGVTLQQILADCNMISRAGLDIHLTVMVGYPWETRDDALRTLELARELMASGQVEMLQSTVVVPYPGTRLYQQAIENDWLRLAADDYEQFDMSQTVFKMPDMEPEEVSQMCAGIYKSFLTPRYVLHQLARLRSPQDLGYALRGFKAVTGHIRDFLRTEGR